MLLRLQAAVATTAAKANRLRELMRGASLREPRARRLLRFRGFDGGGPASSCAMVFGPALRLVASIAGIEHDRVDDGHHSALWLREGQVAKPAHHALHDALIG